MYVALHACSAVFGCGLPRRRPPVQSEYVDARLCAGCHRQIAEDYARTGMGRSFFRPAPSNTLESYAAGQDFYHALSDTHFSMIRRDGQYFQRRWQIGFGGKETNVEELKIDYVMGSGNHARSYLHRTPRGTLIELPLRLVCRRRRPLGHVAGLGFRSSADPPLRLLQVHVLP